MIFVIISSIHNLSATLLLQPFPPSSSPSSRLRCGVVCPLVVCRELTAAMAARCLKNDALSPTRSPRWGLQTGNAVMFCVFRQYKPSLRVYYFLDKLLIDFLNLLFEETWRQSRLGLQGKACKPEHSPVCSVDSFLEQLQNLVLIFCWRLKTVAALADHEFFVEGLSAFLLSSTAGWNARPFNLLLSGETDHRALWDRLCLKCAGFTPRGWICQYQKDLFPNTLIAKHSKSLFY